MACEAAIERVYRAAVHGRRRQAGMSGTRARNIEGAYGAPIAKESKILISRFRVMAAAC